MKLLIAPSPIFESRRELSYTSEEMHGLCSGLISTKCLYAIRELLTKLLTR
ncbi:hypothetical protein PVL29_009582 [Vitis rotundifolia]|uniref:Uncharacterized protein n=1 Tax=Vitis rotundifolia TaxID=103349 RepID=A0AA38ZRP5_VITRO|nr:hypothetical protein PVL29_009582 [Vitis rotundifolia]